MQRMMNKFSQYKEYVNTQPKAQIVLFFVEHNFRACMVLIASLTCHVQYVFVFVHTCMQMLSRWEIVCTWIHMILIAAYKVYMIYSRKDSKSIDCGGWQVYDLFFILNEINLTS